MTRKPPHSAPHKPRDFFANSDFYSLCGWVICAVCFAAFIAVFRLAPWVDLSVSGWFYDPEFGGWWMANNGVAQFIRLFIWYITLALGVFALGGFFIALWRPFWQIPAKIWGFIAVLYITAPLILVNGVLKSYSGRARPRNIAEFDGDKIFTPAFDFANQCVKNCSFVSGEVAGAATLFLSLCLLNTVFPRVGLRMLGGVVLAGAFITRVGMGGHFLSDAIFAFLFVWLMALILHFAFFIKKSR